MTNNELQKDRKLKAQKAEALLDKLARHHKNSLKLRTNNLLFTHKEKALNGEIQKETKQKI
jgi:hypothetical protein